MFVEVSIFLSFFIKNINVNVTNRCVNGNCRRATSIKTGTFFENSTLPVWKQVCILVFFLNDCTNSVTANSVGVTTKTVTSFFKAIRSRVVDHIIKYGVKFDRSGGEYEIDEFLIKHVRDGWHKCCWVAGIVERGSGRYVMVFV